MKSSSSSFSNSERQFGWLSLNFIKSIYLKLKPLIEITALVVNFVKVFISTSVVFRALLVIGNNPFFVHESLAILGFPKSGEMIARVSGISKNRYVRVDGKDGRSPDI